MFNIDHNTKYDYNDLNRKLDRIKSQVFLGRGAAFWAPLMCSLEFYWSEEVDTAATDGIRFWWNPAFFLKSSDKLNRFVLMHELRHVGGLHMLRQGTREGLPWTWACDIRINNDLVKDGYSFDGFPAWFKPELDLPIELPEEDLYDWVMINKYNIGNNPWGNGDFQDISEEEKQKIINNVVKSVTNAKMEGKPGDIPGNTETMLDHFLAPIVPWEVHLREWMGDLQQHDFSWSRPNRRYTDMYLPSSFEDDGRLEHLIYFQDVSGSISNQEILRFNSELKFVWEEFKPKKMTIAQFDTKIQKVDEFNEGDEFAQIEIIGRGGTHLECVRLFINEHKPTAAIIFSDMYVGAMQPLEPPIPILWVSSTGHHEVPFGKLISIKVH